MRKARRFTDEFKGEAVALLQTSGRPLIQIARELGIQPSMLRNWRKIAGTPAGTALPSEMQAPPPQAGSPGEQSAEITRLKREVERLRVEGDILKKNSCHLFGTPEMRFRFIDDHRDSWPVRVLCETLEVSASGYYAWRGRPECARAAANRDLLADVRRIHQQHRGRYGAPRIHAALRTEGHSISRGRVERLMRRHGIGALTQRRFRVVITDSNHGLPIAGNLLDQTFLARRPNEIWLADISYIPTGEGWLYLAVVLDLGTRKVVGWAMRDHLRQELTIAALTIALQRQRPGRGLIQHSDRASQYAAYDYQKLLKANGILASMSRKGNCWDNAPMESWFHTLKTELVHHTAYATREAAKRDLFAYIEGYYNRQRLHSALGYLTPEQAELQAA